CRPISFLFFLLPAPLFLHTPPFLHYILSLHDALPISTLRHPPRHSVIRRPRRVPPDHRCGVLLAALPLRPPGLRAECTFRSLSRTFAHRRSGLGHAPRPPAVSSAAASYPIQACLARRPVLHHA